MSIDRRGFALGLAGTGLAAMVPTAVQAARKVVAGPAKGLDVIVLGAGVSGLNTAWLLEQQGLKVAVLEARQRVGGRVMTLLDQPGYPEMGFNSMAQGYGRGIDAANRAGLELVEVGARYRIGGPPALYIGGQPLTREEWARHPANPFPEAMKAMMPGEVVSTLIAKHNPLKDWTLWTDPANQPLDISLYEFLKAQGLSDPAIRLANDISPYYGTNAYDVSALMLEFNDGFVKAQMAVGTKSLAVKGGNLHLPQAMARLLKGDVLLGKEVVAIETTATQATVTCRDGSRFSAARVVCSLPFSTLRHVEITPGLSGIQARSVTTLPYQPLSIAFLTATAPFWEEDKLPAGDVDRWHDRYGHPAALRGYAGGNFGLYRAGARRAGALLGRDGQGGRAGADHFGDRSDAPGRHRQIARRGLFQLAAGGVQPGRLGLFQPRPGSRGYRRNRQAGGPAAFLRRTYRERRARVGRRVGILGTGGAGGAYGVIRGRRLLAFPICGIGQSKKVALDFSQAGWRYSWRRASMGLRLAARRAGK